MKSIVLSCDKYHPITNHMIKTYDNLWPSNPFVWRVPWNNIYPDFLKDNWGDKVELIKTPVEFKKTIEVLTEDLENDEWIFWASDDVYPIELNSDKAGLVADWVMNVDDDSIMSISFTKWENDFYNTYEDEIKYNDLRFLRRRSIKYQWQHHFWRAGVLKIMFECLDEPKVAKDMDHMQKEEKSQRFFNLINEGKWYMLDHNIGIFGESTAREVNMLLNCADSFFENNLEIPKEFRISDVVRLKPMSSKWKGFGSETKQTKYKLNLEKEIYNKKHIGDSI